MALGVGVVLVIGVGILAAWLWNRTPQAPAASTPPPAATSAEPSVSDVMQKALNAFEAEDYATAEKQAESVLARDPGNDAARRLRDRARSSAATVDSGLKKARASFTAGRFEEASRAAGEVLSVAPGNAEAKRIMEEGAAQSRGRGADEARTQMQRAKSAARSAGAQQLASASYSAALAAERDAQRLYERGRSEDATVKFYEASGLFRSAEVAAQNESSAREARARAERVAAEQPERTTPPPATSTPPPQLPSPPVRNEPVTIPAAPPVTLPPSPPPAAPAPPAAEKPAAEKPPPEKPTPGPEVAVGELLAQYKAALESRNLDALRRLWPSLTGQPLDAIRNEFGHASQIVVEIVDPHISVSGNSAIVNFVRRYALITVDGKDLKSQSRTTMELRRAGNAWVIERIRFEPIR
jgi:tetratricopeptide (TPR) repeat protein